jgi:hypothetical protein
LTKRLILLALAFLALAAPARADMFDHLVTAADAPTLCTALQSLKLCSFDQNNNPQWAPNVLLNTNGPNDQSVQVIISPAVWDNETSPPTLTTPATLAPGFWAIVAETKEDKALEALPNDVTVLVTDRDLATAGQPPSVFILYEDPNFNAAWISTVTVSPTPAGGNYPFGN